MPRLVSYRVQLRCVAAEMAQVWREAGLILRFEAQVDDAAAEDVCVDLQPELVRQ